MSASRRSFLTGTLGSAIAATPLLGRAAERFEWRCVTTWPKNSPGPGITAQRLVERIASMSQGRLKITLYGAGELAPALGVFDAVADGSAQMGHSASFFWQGKMPASVFFTAVPFGLTAPEHHAWIYHGGGQALWDALYRPFGVKPFMAGNTGIGMGGWFKRPIESLSDFQGLKYRMPGLGGALIARLGAVPISVPPGEIFGALQSGLVDGAEFLGPWSDLAFGLYKAAPYYYWPGFHEPNGSAECLINLEHWKALPEDLQAIVHHACAAENAFSLAETEWANSEALHTLIHSHGVRVQAFPNAVLSAARDAAETVLVEFEKAHAPHDEVTAQIVESFRTARQRTGKWSRISTQAFLRARSGEAL